MAYKKYLFKKPEGSRKRL